MAVKDELTSRERVRLALDHKEADRVPLDLGGTFVSTLSLGAYDKLAAHLEETEGLRHQDPPRFVLKWGQSVRPSEDMLQRFHIDTRPLYSRPPRYLARSELRKAGKLRRRMGSLAETFRSRQVSLLRRGRPPTVGHFLDRRPRKVPLADWQRSGPRRGPSRRSAIPPRPDFLCDCRRPDGSRYVRGLLVSPRI